MSTLVRLLQPQVAVEVGTFTGYSALEIAKALPDSRKLIPLHISVQWTSIGVEAWRAAGVGDKVELRIGPALDSLAAMPAEPHIGFAFIDADKPNYINYFEALLPRMTVGGLIAVDNVLWSGRVTDQNADDDDTVAIRAFNEHLAGDDRVETTMLPVGDGLTLCRKLA